jgi:NNP family nitrate/nitrite transporter-like MFS transporter
MASYPTVSNDLFKRSRLSVAHSNTSPVHPYANGVVSGTVGAIGNLGGIIGAIIFRYNGVDYATGIWILGVISIVLNLVGCWIRPIPRNQIGGR